MSVRNASQAVVSGPPDAIEDVLNALGQAGITAHRDESPWPDDPTECALGWIEAETHHGGDEPPSSEFAHGFLERVTATVAPFGYALRIHGVVSCGPADIREIVHRPTGRVVGRADADSVRSLRQFLAEQGYDPDELELRELPDVWRIPEG